MRGCGGGFFIKGRGSRSVVTGRHVTITRGIGAVRAGALLAQSILFATRTRRIATGKRHCHLGDQRRPSIGIDEPGNQRGVGVGRGHLYKLRNA